MPAPSKRPLSGASAQAAKKSKNSATKSTASKKESAVESKRKVPLTAPTGKSTLEEEEEEFDEEDWEDDAIGGFEVDGEDGEGDDDDVDIEGENDQEGEGEGEGSDQPKQPKDLDAIRQARQAQKVDRQARRAAKPNAQVLQESKSLWAKLNRKEGVSKKEREETLKELMTLLEGRLGAVVGKHDGGRVVQSIVKHGGKADREKVALELKGKFVELVQAKYSKFLVLKLIRLCPPARTIILSELTPHIPRLIAHREASGLIEDAYALWCTAKERTAMMKQFWGKETLFSKEEEGKGIDSFIETEQDEARRARVADGFKSHLNNVFDNPEKGAIQHSIIHRLIRDYMTLCTSLSDNEKRRADLFESFHELMPEIVHTRDGAFVVRDFLATTGPKDRKTIVRVFRPHVQKMAEDPDAQTVLFTMFDVIDDTKLVGKSIIGEFDFAELFTAKLGRRIPLYLLNPRSKRHFIPATNQLLAYHDEARSKTSKKDSEVRIEELRKTVSPSLIKVLEDDTEGELLRDAGACLLIAEVMLYASGAGHFNQTTKQIDLVPSFVPTANEFAVSFWKTSVEAGTLVDIACGGGAFVVAELIERLKVTGGKEAGEVKKVFGKEVVSRLDKSGAKGSKVLMEKIASA
ncbi:Puf family RNA-binding protein [Phaffia rhodozyma]|uniref:Puf family RNA-binding protein n=1 Tax=Phaffia rhodozyma TaxID=264483 RepID=A0A0F7SER2_PHARH|nr:Puf family RNA-binding protein [Phaffia rhodozyma]